MRKLLLLLTALLTVGVSGAWGQTTVKVAAYDEVSPWAASGAYITRSADKLTLTTTANSGFAGLTVVSNGTSSAGFWDKPGSGYPWLLLDPGTTSEVTYTITINAPTGYRIKSYSIDCYRWNANRNYVVTDQDGSTKITINTNNAYNLSVSSLNDDSHYFTVKGEATATSDVHFAIKNMTVTLEPINSVTVTYTCENLSGYALVTSTNRIIETGTKFTPPSAPSGYTLDGVYDNTDAAFDYANTNINANITLKLKYHLTTNPITSLVTAAGDIDSNPTNVLLTSIVIGSETSSYYYYSEAGGAVKADYTQSTKEDAAHWIIVGNETDGYKFYNGRFGSAKVAQAASASNDAAITMVDAASNDGTLFDLRYISGAYRFYYKGTAYCTNRLSSSTKVIGIHSNVNAGSATTVFRYYTNALYMQTDINTAKTYTIKSGTRGYLFANASGYVANNFSSTAESAAADANYQWAFVQATNGKYYLYNIGQAKFFGTRTSESERAAISSLATTDWVKLTSTKSASYYPLYLTGTSYNTSTFADVAAKYVNAQGESGDDNKVIYNTYSTLDGGNDYLITELNSFSAADQLLARNTLRTLTGGLRAEHAASLLGAVEEACWKVYTIKGPLGTLEANGEGTYLTNTGKSGSTVAPTTNTSQQWVLIYTGESYLLYNVGADKYLSGNGTDNYALVDRASASAITFRASTAGGSASVATLLNFPVGIGIGSNWLNLNNGDSFANGTTTYDHAEDPNNMFRIEELDGPCYLTTGFYRLKNKLTTDSYGYMGVSGEQLVGNISDINDASTVLKITKNGEGKYYIQTQGKYTKGVRAGNEVSLIDVAPDDVSVDDHEAFTISSNGGYIVIQTHADGPNSHYQAMSGDSYKIKGGGASSDGSQWSLKKATALSVDMHSDGASTNYATFCAPFSYTVGSGTTAYTLSASGNYLVPTPIDGEVTAGTPVLLKGTSSTATLTIGSDYEATPVVGTALTGTYLAKTIDGATDYVLGIDKGVVGFYHWNSNALAANRAYVDTPDASPVKGYVINWGNEDAIESVMDNGQLTKDNAIYNLAGQRLQKLQKGINIVNGKKMIIK